MLANQSIFNIFSASQERGRLSVAVMCGLIKHCDVQTIIKLKAKMIVLMSTSQTLAHVEHVERQRSASEEDKNKAKTERKNVEHYLLEVVDQNVLRMDLLLNDKGQKIEIASNAIHFRYIEIARKVRVLENWSVPMYNSELNLSARGLMWWNPQTSRYEVADVELMSKLRSHDVDSFGLGLLKHSF